MKFIVSFSLFLFSLVASSQEIIVSGKILESSNQQPIEYATISVHAASDSAVITGTVSDLDGEFAIPVISSEDFYIAVQFIGFGEFHSGIIDHNKSHNLGNIELSLSTTTLSEIEIKSRALTSVHKIDKQVFDATEFQNAKGGNATDVLRNLPSVTINSFGELLVRGASGFMVMINGRPVQGDPNVILQQLSANAIEDIEIVTAPSAKYDPDGNAGIINIITRKAATDGKYIVANVLIGMPSMQSYDNANNTPRYGADITYNYKKGKWDYSLGADYRRYDISGRREGYVNTYLNDVLTEFPSDGERSFDEVRYSARAAVSYTPSSKQSINAGVFAGKRSKDRTADILYTNEQGSVISESEFLGAREYYNRYLESGDVLSGGEVASTRTFFNENLRIRKSDFIIGSLDYTHTLLDESQIKVSGLYERTVLGGPTDNANLEYPNTQNVIELQNNNNNNPLDGYRFQIDYDRNVGDIKWESGYQYRYLKHPGEFEYFDRDLINDVWVENQLFTNDINLKRAIHSLYSQMSGSFKKWDYTAGLRLEHFDRTVEIGRPQSTFLLNRWNLFPSINLNYKINEGLKLKAGYSKRIERTTTFKMTPFPEREHSETLEQGDAELLPEYIDLYEVGLVKNWEDHSMFITAYYRRVNNVINRVNTIFSETVLNRIYTNAGTESTQGFEFGATLYPSSKLKFNLGANVFDYKLTGKLFGVAVSTSNLTYSINTSANYDFSPTLKGQIIFNYLSDRVTAQGVDAAFYNPSLSIQKSFMDKRITLGLQWVNIDLGLWGANEQRITTEQSDFFTTTNYVYEVDIIQLNFTYQLNQPSKNVKVPDSEFGKKEF